MTAPDPGLTDLIAAHQFDPVGRICSCGVVCGVVCDNLTYPAHVALQVIAAGTVNWTATILDRDDWKARAGKAEATVASLLAELEELKND